MEEFIINYNESFQHNISLLKDDYMQNLQHYIDSCEDVPLDYQHCVMENLAWRIKEAVPKQWKQEEVAEYRDLIAKLLCHIDDRVIVKQKGINFAYKLYALNLKYGHDVLEESVRNKAVMKHEGTKIFRLDSRHNMRINILELCDEGLLLEGITRFGVLKKFRLGVIDEKKNYYPAEMFKLPNKDLFAFSDEKIYEGTGFRFMLPADKGKKFKFVLQMKDEKRITLELSFGNHVMLSSNLDDSYCIQGSYIIKLRKEKLLIQDASKIEILKHELRFLKNDVLRERHYRLAALRAMAMLIKSRKKKEIWIISDRIHVAGDNGEALFRYLQQIDNDKIKFYFMVDEQSPDYQRMKRFGKVLKFNSLIHQLNFLCADKIISSQADNWIINVFGEDREYMKSLYSFDFVYLKHGIIKDDMSSWLHKHNKNIKLFVTATPKEYQSIVSGNYDYDESIVKLTGLPRYDRLEDERKKKIVFLPTWRKPLAGEIIHNSSKRAYSEVFKETDYYKFYNSLINDEKLLEIIKERGYCGEFYVHNLFEQQAKDFIGNDVIRVFVELADYNRVFKENALLITDYSSVAFDFTYMKKPVIYTQFDKETFGETHTYKPGYFDYERDGLGPVCYDYDSTVQTIIQYIENDCRMEEKYQKRVDDFFCYRDQNNCQRVYEEILKLN